MSIRPQFVAVALLALLTASAITVRADAAERARAVAAVKETRWEDLVPKDWDPMARLHGMNVGVMNDSNPKVLQLMREMREVWDNAPTNDQMNGAAVKLPGYIVPLDEVGGALKEFLLVPYFGACIHVPPPPANQIVHVVAAQPLKGYRMMDAVWVSGTLRTGRVDSVMGTSGYRIETPSVERYVPPSKP
jgi:uncharacterized protein